VDERRTMVNMVSYSIDDRVRDNELVVLGLERRCEVKVCWSGVRLSFNFCFVRNFLFFLRLLDGSLKIRGLFFVTKKEGFLLALAFFFLRTIFY